MQVEADRVKILAYLRNTVSGHVSVFEHQQESRPFLGYTVTQVAGRWIWHSDSSSLGIIQFIVWWGIGKSTRI